MCQNECIGNTKRNKVQERLFMICMHVSEMNSYQQETSFGTK